MNRKAGENKKTHVDSKSEMLKISTAILKKSVDRWYSNTYIYFFFTKMTKQLTFTFYREYNNKVYLPNRLN